MVESSPSLLDIPSACIRDVTTFLPASSVVRFLSTCRMIRSLDDNLAFWNLLQREQSLLPLSGTNPAATTAGAAKRAYLLHAHINPQVSAVQWHHVCPRTCTPSGREGHLGCRLGNTMLLLDGFTDDDYVHYKCIGVDGDWNCTRQIQDGPLTTPSWVYGATLTPLDDRRAIRFGGFRGGGYTNATAEVAVLHFTVDPVTGGNARAAWELMTCRNAAGEVLVGNGRAWHEEAGRAYHSSVLLYNRYLLVIGGMQQSGSILRPILLDTQTWTWYTEGITVGDMSELDEPSGRHGASLVADLEARDRLLLFGGGSGSDLLRSGADNAEVWELKMKGCTAQTVLQSMPWEWHCVMDEPPTDSFTATDKLPLGRCHVSTRVGRNTILFAFGSGRPTCNGLLGYRTDTDTFFSLAGSIRGSIPCDRFTCAAIYLEETGYWFIHGGYTSRQGGSPNGICLLDVAAALQRPFTLHPLDPRPISYPLAEAMAARTERNHILPVLIRGLYHYASNASDSDYASSDLEED